LTWRSGWRLLDTTAEVLYSEALLESALSGTVGAGERSSGTDAFAVFQFGKVSFERKCIVIESGECYDGEMCFWEVVAGRAGEQAVVDA